MSLVSPEIQKAVRKQNEARKMSWYSADNLPKLEQLFFDEVAELDEAVTQAEIGGGAFEVLLECGDALYLFIKLRDARKFAGYEDIPENVSAALEKTLNILGTVGVEPDEVVKLAVVKNSFKYSDYIMNNGYTPDQARSIVRDMWKAGGGTEAWSHVYEQFGDRL